MRQKFSLAILLALLPVLFWGFSTFEDRSLYHPESTDYLQEPWQAIAGQPISSQIENVYFQTPDGVRLNAWYAAPSQAGKPTVIFAHGNGGNIGDRYKVMTDFMERGYGFLAFDYRGYGKSGGTPSEQGLYEDMRAASLYLTEIRKIPVNQQIAMGESLGSAVAVKTASEIPFRAVILFSSLTTASAVATHIKDTLFPDFLRWIPIESLIRQQFDSLSRIGRVRSPLLIMHGDADEMMPLAMPRELYAKAGSPLKRLLIIRSGGHNTVFYIGENRFFAELENLLTQPG